MTKQLVCKFSAAHLVAALMGYCGRLVLSNNQLLRNKEEVLIITIPELFVGTWPLTIDRFHYNIFL